MPRAPGLGIADLTGGTMRISGLQRPAHLGDGENWLARAARVVFNFLLGLRTSRGPEGPRSGSPRPLGRLNSAERPLQLHSPRAPFCWSRPALKLLGKGTRRKNLCRVSLRQILPVERHFVLVFSSPSTTAISFYCPSSASPVPCVCSLPFNSTHPVPQSPTSSSTCHRPACFWGSNYLLAAVVQNPHRTA